MVVCLFIRHCQSFKCHLSLGNSFGFSVCPAILTTSTCILTPIPLRHQTQTVRRFCIPGPTCTCIAKVAFVPNHTGLLFTRTKHRVISWDVPPEESDSMTTCILKFLCSSCLRADHLSPQTRNVQLSQLHDSPCIDNTVESIACKRSPLHAVMLVLCVPVLGLILRVSSPLLRPLTQSHICH